MVFKLLQRRTSQASSIASSTSTSSSASSSSSSSMYSPLEAVQGALPRELFEAATPSKKAVKCSLELEKESWSNPFSFPRSHTRHHVCPKHGIRHDPFLALPGRDERSFETGQYREKKVSLRKTKTNRT
ncbi:hypothetical protein JCM11491_004856 [Sporobolomyces phaffii]